METIFFDASIFCYSSLSMYIYLTSRGKNLKRSSIFKPTFSHSSSKVSKQKIFEFMKRATVPKVRNPDALLRKEALTRKIFSSWRKKSIGMRPSMLLKSLKELVAMPSLR